MKPTNHMCQKCELWEHALTNCMPIAGSITSNLLIIGEAPGAEEDEEGIPFIGKSGRLLRAALKNAGITNFAITNICRCRPPKNRTPKQTEVDTCIPYLYEDLLEMENLKLIVCVGNVALRALTGKQGTSKVSGEEWEYTVADTNADGHPVRLMPLMHPSYVLQNIGELDRFFDHVARIPRILEDELTADADLGEYFVIQTLQQWKEFKELIANVRFFSYDIETTGLNPYDAGARIKCIQMSPDLRIAYVLPIAGWSEDDWSEIYNDLLWMFTNKKIGKVGQNIKFDNLWMKVILDIGVKGVFWDTKLAEYLLIGKGSTGLKDMAWKYSKLGGYEKRLPHSPEKVEEGEELYRYGAIDADLTYRICVSQQPRLRQKDGVYHLYKTLMVPVSDVLMNMERRGIRVDNTKIKLAEHNCNKLIEDLIESMRDQYAVKLFEENEDKEFNPNSHAQIAHILFKIKGLEPLKWTEKKQPSTDQEVLEYYETQEELCRLLLDYSTYNQMRKTFLKELLEFERNGRIHTTLWLTETTTGRTSSKKPNMQNMPKGGNDILGLRKCFIADDGFLLCEPDMNQHELRVMAEIARDEVMKQALQGDIHTATAAAVLGIDPADVTSDQRREVGKTINFGLIYGLTKWGLMKRLKISEKEADKMLFRFFEKYYMTQRFQEETKAFVQREGYVEALSGRQRQFPSWEEFDERRLKEAINFPIQATASDILLYGAIAVDRLLRGKKSFLVLEVHDSLLINLHKSEMGLIDDIKEVMCTYFKQFMPFESDVKVDVKIGENWAEMEEA